eukprot:gene37098-48449_t
MPRGTVLISPTTAPKRPLEESTSSAAPVSAEPASNTDSPASKKTCVDLELIEQVSKLVSGFFRKSLNWTGGDDELTFKSTKNSLVEGRSYYDPDSDDGEEHFIIKRKDGIAFTERFLTTFRPELVKVVNTIVDANNEWLKATNYHESCLEADDLKHFLDLQLSPIIPSGCSSYNDEELGPQPGALGLVRESGNRLGRRWDYHSAVADEEDGEDIVAKYADKPKGKELPLGPVAV